MTTMTSRADRNQAPSTTGSNAPFGSSTKAAPVRPSLDRWRAMWG